MPSSFSNEQAEIEKYFKQMVVKLYLTNYRIILEPVFDDKLLFEILHKSQERFQGHIDRYK